ncbi:hypothetical protein FEDK69T_15150 [Flavobacterium enshiense DK69]|uniref:hypothetical protein n=1 Tax=Flavobacterium enshiense TaxID=1341165 RepID=UPI0003C61988|nr:hypothetical protein [Flavobacterium enshiense]ESU23353.1 hypothetical protein FEDK69T_15150 [Flavobacterium enshiense DK69]
MLSDDCKMISEDSLSTLTTENKEHYKELYGFIVKISDAGKLVFDGTTKKNE